MTTRMSLKVLYTVDKETNSYLTRSKAPVEARIESIPSPSNDGTQLRVGIVLLNDVLEQVCASSPELFSYGMDNSVDYNVYCRDICELDEPLVSFGLLSKLRGAAQQQSKNDVDDWPLVMGRVCSSFSAILRFQNIANTPPTQQTLEIKIRFSKVATANSSRRSSVSGNNVHTLAKKAPTTTTSMLGSRGTSKAAGEMAKPEAVTKRQTNPMPAPKAARTQSLPIWNQSKNNQFALPANSIAHKIYLADRAAKDTASSVKAREEKKPVVYQINSLQQDNTIQKTKVDDSVSKRFDFITKKKGKMAKPSIKKPVAKPKSSVKKVRRDSVVQASTPLPREAQTSSMINKNDALEEFKLLNDDVLVQQLLDRQKLKPTDFFELDQEKGDDSENKENIPPRPVPLSSRFEDLIGMDIPSFKTPSDSEKTGSVPRSDDTLEWFNDLFGSPIGNQKTVTPTKDPLTCNTLPIEDDEQDPSKALTSDIDRTSPMDTLSMPLYELEHKKESKGSEPVPSCKEQLRRLPILTKNSHSGHQDDVRDADSTTPVVLGYSTSPKSNNNELAAGQKRPAPVPSSPADDEDYMDEYMQERRRKRKTMPSSPTSMFPYREQDGEDEHSMTNDEFSIHERPCRDDANSTPATQYRSSDVENMKHGEESSAETKQNEFLHI
ncbi:Spt21p [Lachancea thermotolerans CBS 6340]|uniref:KLTH0H03278p n=1 Tax=Lachancea thermotolerans (strain ATCC 56472 / CBS 6340 / NRRL Y-8284) TaxID=559295 RepID=C5E2A1_LACTC|nr:KLTH0H03278p [Lachancea thermotolerans CBS 6340]CAR30162.1 KLTH0H03278p [Lachancea thermotolerans CBS 6340]